MAGFKGVERAIRAIRARVIQLSGSLPLCRALRLSGDVDWKLTTSFGATSFVAATLCADKTASLTRTLCS